MADDDENGVSPGYVEAESAQIPKTGYAYIERVSPKSSPDKMILSPMMVDFPESAVTAILGPSGSGKTTMLSVVTDSVQTNVIAVADVKLPGLCAFVPQDDRLHGFFTVRSYMMHYARMTGIYRNPDIEERIDKLLRQLGLSEQADTIVGDIFFKGLSGGQKRRLSIALEALTEPMNFFLDEPTSGLDAESAYQVMMFLREYVRAARGRRVILTIHQPSSFIWEKIDQIVLLSKGKLMYSGSRERVESFFLSCGFPTPAGWNPADHYITVVNDEFRDHELSVDEWAEKYHMYSQTKEHQDASANMSKSMKKAASQEIVYTSRSSKMSVILELTYRYFLSLAFNPGILLTRVAMYSMLALMVGALFWDLGDRYDYESVQSRIALTFYCSAFFIFMSVAVLPFTVMERDIVDKEVRNKYYNPMYYQISQAISSIPSTAILAALVTLIIITMTKLNGADWYFLIMFLALMVAEALAHLVSHVVPHFVIGMALLAGLYGFFMLFQGFMLVPSEFPKWLEWVYYVAFHTYAWRSFMMTEFGVNQTFTGETAFGTGEQVLIFYEIENVDCGNDMWVLVGFFIGANVCACAILWCRYHLFDGKIEQPSRPPEPITEHKEEGDD